MQHGRNHQDRLFHAGHQRAQNTPPDEPATNLEAELLACGRHRLVPREGVIGAYTSRVQPSELVAAALGNEMAETGVRSNNGVALGADVAPTELALQRERERHQRECERRRAATPAESEEVTAWPLAQEGAGSAGC